MNTLKPVVCTLVVLSAISVASCVSNLFNAMHTSGYQTAFRVENATASAVDVVVEVLDENGNLLDTSQSSIDIPVVTITTDDVSYSTLEPIGAAAAQQSSEDSEGTSDEAGTFDGGKATVRVPGFSMSEGVLTCGKIIKVTATIDGDEETAVLFSGAGTGTPGFDEGSVGQDGERYLIKGEHFICGQNIVIRIGSDSSTGASSASQTTSGVLAVVDAGETSPFDPIDVPGEGGTGALSTINVVIENQASIIADVNLVVAASAGEQTFETSIPPDETTEGIFTCGTQLTVSATFPNTDRPPSQSASDEYPDATIVLTGDGTGAIGFDEASIAATGERILVVGTHVNCGDTVTITIVDDSAVMTPNGFNGVATGAGVVTVGDEDDPQQPDPSQSEPDMSITVGNQTPSFMRVNIVAGAANLGQQLDIYIPANGESQGAVSCADRYTLTAYSLLASALDGLQDQVLIVLEGDGTGTAGFDEGSVGAIGQRVLVRGVHYECGDTIDVTLTDPGTVGYPEPDMLNTNGDVIGFHDINGNGIQDDIPDTLGRGTVDVEPAD